jgi:hypothetical protein
LPRISSTVESKSARWSQLYLGVAFTTLGTLILELALTRIFSVVFFYHFAFLAISIALFGLGVGGVFSYVIAGWRGNIYFKLGSLAVANSFAVLVSLVFLLTRTGVPGKLTLAVVYFAAALPFLFSGMVVSMAVAEGIQRVDRLYFFDLLGAAGGCLLLIPFLNYFGGPNTVLVSAVLFAVSAAIWYNLADTQRGRVFAVLIALGFVTLIVCNFKWRPIDVHYAKGSAIPNELLVKWNSFSRVGLNHDGGYYSIVIDADAATAIPTFNPSFMSDNQRFDLLHTGPGFPYVMRPAAKTLIIGPGGGYDVARSLASGSKDVTAVEINPIIAQTIMQQRFPDVSDRLYFRPEVHVHIEDGRSFVRGSSEKFQVLQATLVDTWASTAAGAFALSENNLYTTDAFHDYLTHLTDDGLMAFTRWGFEPPRESLRLLTLASAALQGLGETEPWKHILVLREQAENIGGFGALDTVLISRKPFSAADLERAAANVAGTHLQILYSPANPPTNEFGQYMKAADPEAFLRDYRFNISAVDDDRPFFFYTVQGRDVWTFLKLGRDQEDAKINRALSVLLELMGISVVATLMVLGLPPLLLRTRLPREKGVRRFLLYFVCIGAGYILIQVALIQKFVLFLGHPNYALTVIVFSMLVSSGLGSYYSRQMSQRLSTVLIGVAALVSVLAFIAAPISEFGAAWPLPLKMAVTACLIAPAGFLMGMPFPAGLTRLEARFPQAVRWAWALNAAASVLGSVGAICLAIYIGLRLTLLIGGGLYLCALLLSRLQKSADNVTYPVAAEASR